MSRCPYCGKLLDQNPHFGHESFFEFAERIVGSLKPPVDETVVDMIRSARVLDNEGCLDASVDKIACAAQSLHQSDSAKYESLFVLLAEWVLYRSPGYSWHAVMLAVTRMKNGDFTGAIKVLYPCLPTLTEATHTFPETPM